MAIAEEARRKAEDEATHLEVELTSLLLEIRAAKDEVSSLQSQADKDKEAIEEDYQKALEMIFAYGYGCYVFKHNIYGNQPEVPDGMPDSSPEFFLNPRCPSALSSTEVTTARVNRSEAAKEPKGSAFARDQI